MTKEQKQEKYIGSTIQRLLYELSTHSSYVPTEDVLCAFGDILVKLDKAELAVSIFNSRFGEDGKNEAMRIKVTEGF